MQVFIEKMSAASFCDIDIETMPKRPISIEFH